MEWKGRLVRIRHRLHSSAVGILVPARAFGWIAVLLALSLSTASAENRRALVELRKGLKSQGQADLAAARHLQAGIDEPYAGMGLKP
jgi:hypothetical protein